MKRILGIKTIADLTLIVLLVGGLVYTLGFGISLYIARQEVMKESSEKVNLALECIQKHVDGELLRVEDVAYTLAGSTFANTYRNADGNGIVGVNAGDFQLPTEEKLVNTLEQFLNSNPHICGVAIGFDNSLYPDTKGKYGFAAYVTNVSGRNKVLKLGEIHDFHKKEWYTNAAQNDSSYWSRPFKETSQGKVVTCFSLPLHGPNKRIIGVLAIDIDTETFREECANSSPFPNSEVAIVDREFRFVSHPDTTFILRTVAETGVYDDYKADDSMRIKMKNCENGQYTVNEGSSREALFSFAPIKRNGWTISIESPKSDLFGGVERMKRDTTLIAVISILIMIVCFIFFFRRLQKVTLTKASIERELNIASAIQMGMLPKLYPAFPDRNEIDVYGYIKSAKSVGGDLYDYFIRNDKLFCCIGDVSGKGIPASLFMAVIRSLFRNVSLHNDNPAEILSQLNDSLSEGNEHNMFCTIFLGIMDLKTGHVDFCNAGHNAPIIRQIGENGKVTVRFTKPKVNLAVGVIPDFPYEKEEITLKPGEAIFLYTDGVTESEDVDKQLFGEDATMKALLSARDNGCKSAKDIVHHVANRIQQHAANAEQSDDITMVVMRYIGTNT